MNQISRMDKLSESSLALIRMPAYRKSSQLEKRRKMEEYERSVSLFQILAGIMENYGQEREGKDKSDLLFEGESLFTSEPGKKRNIRFFDGDEMIELEVPGTEDMKNPSEREGFSQTVKRISQKLRIFRKQIILENMPGESYLQEAEKIRKEWGAIAAMHPNSVSEFFQQPKYFEA